MTWAVRATVLVMVLWATGAPAQPCNPCELPTGTYRAVAPPGWDGRAPLKLLMFLHGWQGSAAETLGDADVTGPAASAFYLLIAPDGIGKRWSFRGSPAGGRDDLAFVRQVLDDVGKRWPVDPRHVVIGGFSIGASLVWDLACHDPAGFTAFLPISGGFWMPIPDTCSAAPVNLRQTHGRSDTTFPLSGRPIGQRMRQADVIEGFSRWRAIDGCPAMASEHSVAADMDCTIWRGCASGRELQLCLHPGGHMIEAHYLAAGLRWADLLP